MAPNTIIVALALCGSFASLFERHDARLPATFAAVLRRYECVTLNGVRAGRTVVNGDWATAELTVDATGFLPLTHAPREFPPHWTAHFRRHGIAWEVDDVSIPEAELAKQLATTSDWLQRQRMLDARSELFDGELARQLSDLAFAANSKGDYGAAAADAEMALAMAREIAPGESARALWLIGRAHDSAFDEDGAAGPLLESQALASRSGDREIEARALIGTGWVHISNSDLTGSIEPLNAGLKIAEALGEHEAAAEGYMGLANGSLVISDDPIGALRAYEKALAHATHTDNAVIQAAILGNIGSVYDRLADFPLSADYYERALALYRKAGNTKGVMRTLRNLADIAESSGQIALAARHASENDALLAKEPNPRIAAYAALTWAKIDIHRRKFATAEKKARESMAGATATGNPLLHAHAMFVLSEVRARQHRYRESIELAGQVVAACMTWPDFNLYWIAKQQIGDTWMKLGDLVKARAAIQEAIDAIEYRRPNVPGSGENEQRFLGDKATVYYSMFRVAVAGHDIDGALKAVERARAQTLLASLALGRLKSTRYLTPEEQDEEQRLDTGIAAVNVALRDARSADNRDPAAIAQLEKDLDQKRRDRTDLTNRLYTNHPELSLARGDVPTPSTAQLRAAIPPDGVVLEYMVEGDDSFVVVLTRDGVPRVHPLHIGQIKMQRLVESFTKAISHRDLDYKPAARKLYDMLIAPAASVLQSKKIVCIVTDGVLWGLPFQALIGPDGHYLIEGHALFYAPSLTLMSWYATHKRIDREPRRTLLALAGPPLVDAEDEVRRIASLFDPRETLLLTGARATESRFKQEAGHFRILHVASHGMFEDAAPMYSHIDMARAPGDSDDGVLEAREIASLDLHADLAILSSCDTGRGLMWLGEGMVGMSWALLAAGCPRSVLTQWKIGSASAHDLMILFHRRLSRQPMPLRGRAATDALRRAQIAMLKRSFSHPFYWSAFILIGDGW
jgi:CHAT domain-containing protein